MATLIHNDTELTNEFIVNLIKSAKINKEQKDHKEQKDEEYTDKQKQYLKLWNTNFKYIEVLRQISLEDFRKIVPKLDLGIGHTIYNNIFPVFDNIQSDDQLELILTHDKQNLFPVSKNYNELLCRAAKNKNKNLMNAILKHGNFKYPGDYKTLEQEHAKTFCYVSLEYLSEQDFLENVEYVFEHINSKFKNNLICDFFTSINLHRKQHLVQAGMKIFVQNKILNDIKNMVNFSLF